MACDIAPPRSVIALVGASSDVEPELVAGDIAGHGWAVACWRRTHAHLEAPAALDEHLVSYCIRGSAMTTVMVGGRRLAFEQQAGSVMVLTGGAPVQWHMQAWTEVQHMHLYIAPWRWPGTDVSPAGAGPGAVLAVRDAWFDAYFRMLRAECECGPEDARDCFERNHPALLRRLAGLGRRPAERRACHSRITPLRGPLLRRIDAFIDEHMAEEVRVEQMAQLAAMSVDHFARTFQQAVGATPHRYLVERRLDRACSMLRASTAPVAEVASRCGFAGAAHFSTCFRDRLGMTPSQYRRRA